ncbi:hypothetical protein ACFLTH_15370 [Bacteroidota bacterium]
MNPHLADEDLHSEMLDKLISLNVKGGQNSDGSQKDGFFKYEKGRPSAVYNIEKKEYVPITDFQQKCDEKLGDLPKAHKPWKGIIGDPKKKDILQNYFNELADAKTFGTELAKNYAKRAREIGLKLVNDKVANSEDDVNTVLLTGFFHAYGPINDYLNWEEIK